MTDTELQQKRLIAAAIDVAIVIALCVVAGVGHVLIGMVLIRSSGGLMAQMVSRGLEFATQVVLLGYMLLRDVLAGDRSIGKKMMDIRVVGSSGGAIEFMDSVKRNLIFAVGSVLGTLSAALGLFPCVGDVVRCLLFPLMLLGVAFGLVAFIVEIVKIITDPAGIRFGDGFAGTKVVR